MKANRTVGIGSLLLLAVALGVLVPGCRDHQEAAVNELYETDYAFTVEEFFRAAAAGDLKAVRWFLNAGMGVGVADVSASQALHMAAGAGRPEVVAALLVSGADPAAPRADGRTPLMLAAEAGDGRSVELLLDAGSPAQDEDKHGWTALALAAYGGFGRAVEALVPFSGASLNDALLLAAMSGSVGAIDPLVGAAAELDVRSPDARTPLMLAAARGHRDAVKLLLHHGANWYATDVEAHTASQLAASGGHGEIVNLLESARLQDAERAAREVPPVGDAGAEAVLYTSRIRRLDGERLVGGARDGMDLRHELHMLAYRERQLPILFDGAVDAGAQVAELRLLFGDNATYHVAVGETIPQTELELQAIEQHWFTRKDGDGKARRSLRLVVRDAASGEVIGVTPDDPGRSAKSFALVRHANTGQVYEVRRGDRFVALGSECRVLDLRPAEVLVEELGSGVVIALPCGE